MAGELERRVEVAEVVGRLSDGDLDGRAHLRGVGHVELSEDAADLLGEGRALVGLEVGDDDRRALRSELAGGRGGVRGLSGTETGPAAGRDVVWLLVGERDC